MATNALHGSRVKYNQGCRCDPCKSANRDYNRELRNRKAAAGLPDADGLASVSKLPGAAQQPVTDGPGRVEAQVLLELGMMNSPAKHPGLAESALAMARILDNHNMLTTHPAAQRALRGTLADLHDKSASRVGRLAKVASMSRTVTAKEHAV